jgi:hypothetical protein
MLGSIRTSVNGKHNLTLQIWLMGFVVCLIPSVLFVNQELWRGNPIQKFIIYIYELERYELSIRAMGTSFICMMITLPFLLKLSLDIMDIFQSYFATWDVNLVPANLHFNNPFGMSHLGNVESILLNKRALINERDRYVKVFRVGGKCYFSE